MVWRRNYATFVRLNLATSLENIKTATHNIIKVHTPLMGTSYQKYINSGKYINHIREFISVTNKTIEAALASFNVRPAFLYQSFTVLHN